VFTSLKFSSSINKGVLRTISEILAIHFHGFWNARVFLDVAQFFEAMPAVMATILIIRLIKTSRIEFVVASYSFSISGIARSLTSFRVSRIFGPRSMTSDTKTAIPLSG